MNYIDKCMILIIILQILPQLLHIAGLTITCEIPEISEKYNYTVNNGKSPLVEGYGAPDGTTVIFTCKNNLMLYPTTSQVSICRGGLWTNDFPQCLRFCAPRISEYVDVECDFKNKTFDCTALIPVPEGTIARMKCKENLILSSPSPDKALCKDGKWDNGLLQCVQEPKIKEMTICERDGVEVPCSNGSDETSSATDCILPEQPNNGKYVLLGGVTNDTILKYDCINNYVLYPSYYLILCQNGQWSPEIPQCLSTCPPRLSESVDTICTRDGIKQDCSKRMVEGTQVTMKCKHLYVQNDNSINPVSVCRDNSWDYDFIKCVPECGKLTPEGTPLVVGGENAVKGSFPWHVGIYRQKTPGAKIEHKCGGSIISTRVVLSAAHCFASNTDGSKFDKNEFYIGAGKYFRDYDEAQDTLAQKSKVKDLIIPSDYKGFLSNFAGNVALVVLQTPFIITHVVQPVCVDWKNQFEDNQLRIDNKGSVVGWGFTVEGKTPSKELKQLNVPYIDRGDCFDIVPETFYPFLTPDKFCAGFTNGSSVCNGDSGGGLVFHRPEDNKYYIRGLVSAGPVKDGQCDSKQYGIYTKVSLYLNYLSQVETANRQ